MSKIITKWRKNFAETNFKSLSKKKIISIQFYYITYLYHKEKKYEFTPTIFYFNFFFRLLNFFVVSDLKITISVISLKNIFLFPYFCCCCCLGRSIVIFLRNWNNYPLYIIWLYSVVVSPIGVLSLLLFMYDNFAFCNWELVYWFIVIYHFRRRTRKDRSRSYSCKLHDTTLFLFFIVRYLFIKSCLVCCFFMKRKITI